MIKVYTDAGANAVEFIMDHAEISIAFVQESKLKSVSGDICPFLTVLLPSGFCIILINAFSKSYMCLGSKY